MLVMNRIRIAKYLCLLPGVFLIISRLIMLISPDGAGLLFGIADIEKLKEPMALAMGIRQLTIGLMITILAFSNQNKALGLIMFIGAIVPLSDFIIFSTSIGWISSLRHLAPVPFILGLGLYLLYKTRETDS